MAKGQMRSNREKKKPKQTKPKPGAAAATLSTAQSKPGAPPSSKKKY